jgi:NAD(P)-dependent dehydrogenase (short-subunit alcohol dehydrogenase family)
MTKGKSNKIAVVTGGGSGIGKGVCLELAADGADVIILDLNIDAAEETVADIDGQGGSARAIKCDISKQSEVNSVFSEITKSGPIDILVNSAGIAHVGNVQNTSESDLDRLYAVNVKGVYNTTHATVPAMQKQKNGVIINLASVAAVVGIEDRFAYSMTKGAVVAMTLSVAKDYINDGIRCNCISPGRVHTPFVDAYLEKNYPGYEEEMFERLSKTQPIGRMGTPTEIARLIKYLCSDDASFITGSNFPIDGGFITLNN